MLADVLKRFRALRDGATRPKPVLLTGTDEHGAKIQKAAKLQGVEPIELCDKVSKRFEVRRSMAELRILSVAEAGLCYQRTLLKLLEWITTYSIELPPPSIKLAYSTSG